MSDGMSTSAVGEDTSIGSLEELDQSSKVYKRPIL